jgi:hypothetical protein
VRLSIPGCTLLALVVSSLLVVGAVAPPSGTVTMTEGAVTLLRDTAKYPLVEGVRLRPGDVIEVGETGMAQLEFSAGVVAALGRGTRAMVMSVASGRVDLFLLTGTAKAAVPKAAARLRLGTSTVSVSVGDAVTVLAVSPQETGCFAESGESVLDFAPPLRLKAGEFWSRKGGQNGVVAARPPQAFVAGLPRAFLDSLPPRMARLADREVPLGKPQPYTYAEVAAWLGSTPAVRRVLVTRWGAKVHDPAFRKALIASLSEHPEWDPVLFPEKYLTKGK